MPQALLTFPALITALQRRFPCGLRAVAGVLLAGMVIVAPLSLAGGAPYPEPPFVASGHSDIHQLRALAEQGDAHAAFVLGGRFLDGKGVPPSPLQAQRWITWSAQLGLPQAQYHLGVQFAEGNGVPRDHRAAAFWFEHAARQGLPEAQFDLGMLYVFGMGVPRDRERALHWLQQAAQQDMTAAQYKLAVLLEWEGRHRRQVEHWYERAGRQGYAPAMQRLAQLRADQEYENARLWLMRQNPAGFTLQVSNQPSPEGARAFIRRHQLGAHAFYLPISYNGEVRYPVFYGMYPDKDAGRRMRTVLPRTIQAEGPWPRNIGELQKKLAHVSEAAPLSLDAVTHLSIDSSLPRS